MVQITKRIYSFEEYLACDDITDKRCELVDGELIAVPQATGRQTNIARFLFKHFDQEIERRALPWITCYGDVGVRTSFNKSRMPDLLIITQEQQAEILDVAAVVQSPAILAVEIVRKNSATTDYRHKRSEYAVAGIPEYWIIDFYDEKVTNLFLFEGFYDEQVFTGDEKIISQTFPHLDIKAFQLLQG
ncbi:Uma2 family endonuclease [Nostoc sp. FACHB-110]|uniref:Uma2 family endonuclease n=1 Tax=Nostoc sp. FACHB-110 TaxID=2692834 RepID=UPI0016855CDB|nr:Uma2 family endonuclease [Nostoc sp. FACHB-110]MBD2441464.1 Uma2 family endonuclease [Nostoc sp. FACHB-110]